MCGIAGIIGSGANEHRQAVKRMLDSMRHRGPDGEGIWTSNSGTCVLGHRRLAILDLSTAAAQPMATPNNQFALSYNGECYNFQTLRRELEQQEIRFSSHGDTEVFLQLLAQKGAAALRAVNAMFALAFWNENSQTLLLGRDRFGQKPLYWAPFEDGILFASEVRAILASGLVSRHMSARGILSYLCHGSVQGPDTIVEGVQLLDRASTLEIRAGEQPRIVSYWHAARDIQPLQQPLDRDEIRSTFIDAIRSHLISDVPTGVFLSGGIDSSLVAAAACHVAGKGVTSLSVIFPDHQDQSEEVQARRQAELIGSNHIEVPVGNQEIQSLSKEATEALDQPSVDGINTYIVSGAARRAGLRVALSGLAADELLGGYGTFRSVPRLSWLRALGTPLHILRNYLPRGDFWDRRWAKLSETIEMPRGLISSYINRRRLFCSSHVRKLSPESPTGWISGLTDSRMRGLESLVNGRNAFDAVAHLELEVYMGQTLLRDTDVMGMAHSLEIRVPFLDTKFSELALSLPSNTRSMRPYGKWVLIDSFRDWLPEQNWRRPKRGFTLPWAPWLLGELRATVEKNLEALVDHCPMIDRATVQELWQKFQQQPRRVGWSKIWALSALGDYLVRNELTMPTEYSNVRRSGKVCVAA